MTTSNSLTTWEIFLQEATAIFVAKNTDYDSRFTRALIQYQAERGPEAARTIWAWEVEKKLDRCRTWIKRGELLVKDEGVRNSVIDLFNYSVQYLIFRNYLGYGRDPFSQLNEEGFHYQAAKLSPAEWIGFLIDKGLIKEDEAQLRRLILTEMLGPREVVSG
ncbi:hypothetical protein [Paenibacillus sp. L3-i20]|uniref:hypothetical protein n=1 Tax=Paenibacillus sp. L3-i20 TaxID=2905833 RepID=UPI001EDD75AB|nr:hypothetical protein [Paenibacillus sp. L3-i20]GKU79319.1 hypothetical protein L3i20_v237160 [Paenibacillus sp. L3-i20]